MDNSVFEKLKSLQDILAQKNKLEAEIADAPKALVSREELLERLKSGYIEKNSEYEELKKTIAILKADVFETDQKREKAEKAMDNIETQREYEILQKEIDDSSVHVESTRKELQLIENNFRILNETIKQEEDLIKQNEDELEESKLRLDQEVAEKNAELEQLKLEEDKLSPGLSEETMFKFNRIIKSKQDAGIVAVNVDVCTGCHMILPAQFVNEVRADSEIKFCPYCSRILFYDNNSEVNEQESFFDDSDMGGLADLDDISSNLLESSGSE